MVIGCQPCHSVSLSSSVAFFVLCCPLPYRGLLRVAVIATKIAVEVGVDGATD
jgi:hypothetical protein